jgi:hypothetical protein
MEFYTCIHILQVKETKEGEASLKTKKQPSKATIQYISFFYVNPMLSI